MIETIYIARHGFRANFENAHWVAPTGTNRDVPLTAHGVNQAKELAEHFSSSGIKLDMIFSSPYYRCLTSAAPSAEKMGLKISVEDGIGEWYLPCSKGLHPKLLPPEELAEFVPAVSPSQHSALLRPTRRGESREHLHLRTHTFLRLLLAHLDSHPSKPRTILLMTHAATNITLGRALMGEAPDGKSTKEVRTGCCSLGKYVRQAGARPGELGTWKQELNGDCNFLAKGEERNWAFSFVEDHDEVGSDDSDSNEPQSFTINPYNDPRNPSTLPGIPPATSDHPHARATSPPLGTAKM